MKEIFNTYRPDGFGTVNSYLFTEHPEILIKFLKDAFYAEELNRSIDPTTGEVSNCILKIGVSCFMISQAREPFTNMTTALYLYVEDVDLMHDRAITHGGKLFFAPEDMSYKDRQSGVIDPSGNYWWISKRLVHQAYD